MNTLFSSSERGEHQQRGVIQIWPTSLGTTASAVASSGQEKYRATKLVRYQCLLSAPQTAGPIAACGKSVAHRRMLECPTALMLP